MELGQGNKDAVGDIRMVSNFISTLTEHLLLHWNSPLKIWKTLRNPLKTVPKILEPPKPKRHPLVSVNNPDPDLSPAG